LSESTQLKLRIDPSVSLDMNQWDQGTQAARSLPQPNAERFAQILEIIPDPCVVTDSIGIIEQANSSAAAFLQVPLDRLIGSQLEQYVFPVGYSTLVSLLDAVPFSFTRAFESTIKLTTGETCEGYLKVTALAALDAAQSSFLWQLQDRTPRKSAQSAGHSAYKKANVAIREISQEFESNLGRRRLMNVIADRVEELLQPDSLVIYSFQPKRGELELEIAKGLDTIPGTRVPLGEGAIGLVARDRQPMLVENQEEWPFLEPRVENRQISAAIVPMVCFDELLGVMAVALKDKSIREFDWDDVRLLSIFASLEGVVVSAAQTRDALKQEAGKRKRAEEELKNALKTIRNLTAKMELIREEERTQVARQIHDELGQLLTGFRLDLSWLAKNQKAILKKSKSMLKLSDTTLESVQRISSELRPGVLDELGLAKAIEWQMQDFQSRTGIKCNAKLDFDDHDLDRHLATAVFRIFQEAITNIARHAHATRMSVKLRDEEGDLLLTVADNGRGIEDDDKNSAKSLGLVGMRERAEAFAGTVEISSVRGKGTTVVARLPVRRSNEIAEAPT
jgi:signal transduction histidine kinase/PAS domain-containing protein